MVLPLQVLPSLSTCTACALHSVARSVGIGLHRLPQSLPPSPLTPCVLFVGQNPGYNEDLQGLPFIGKSGTLLQDVYCAGISLFSLACVYVTNTARCYHKNGDGPTNLHYRTCRPNLLSDLRHLSTLHPSPLLVVTLGGPATTHLHAVLSSKSMTLTKAFSSQGRVFPLPSIAKDDPCAVTKKKTKKKNPASALGSTASSSDTAAPATTTSEGGTSQSPPSPEKNSQASATSSLPSSTTPPTDLILFSTFHPAAILRTAKLIHAVSGHLQLLLNHLTGQTPVPSSPILIPGRSPTP